jgi:Prion-inhibition and propagation
MYAFSNGKYLVIELILKAKDLKPEFQYLNIRLQLEKQKLWNWSNASGLLRYLGGDEDALDSSLTGLHRHDILEVVLQIQKLVTEFVKVKGRYEEFLSDEREQRTVRRSGQPSKKRKLSVEEDNPREPEFVKQIPGSCAFAMMSLKALEVTQKLPKRLRWAVSDQEKLKGLVDRLKELNDSLVILVDNSIKMQILQITKETNINFLALCNKVDDLSQLFLALALQRNHVSTPTSHWIPPSLNYRNLPYMELEEEENREFQGLTRFKHLNQSIEYETLDVHLADVLSLQQPGERTENLEIPFTDMRFISTAADREELSEGRQSEAFYRDRFVWIEWKTFQVVEPKPKQPEPDSVSLRRVQKLTALLCGNKRPTVFRAPQCLGYFIDRESPRFGFVFAKPAEADPLREPIDLFELLNRPSVPPLTERIALATVLANCVRYLHSVNWLHKCLRSHNIVFFPEQSNKINYSMPYLTGFDYARPERDINMTEPLPLNPEFNIYKHPHIQLSTGYRRSFDIYSLGIILAEIAQWKSIDRILGIHDPKKTSARVALRIRSRLLEEVAFMEGVAAGAGSSYERSVRICLQGGAALGIADGEDENNEEVAAKIGKIFYEEVVKRLEGIRC